MNGTENESESSQNAKKILLQLPGIQNYFLGLCLDLDMFGHSVS